MRKLFWFSLVCFLVVSLTEVVLVTYPENIYKTNENGVLQDPDLNYYVVGGKLGTGHDLTILISQPLAKINLYIMPLTFFAFFVFGAYYLIKPFVKYPELALILAPLTPLLVILAQIFSIGFFWFALGVYFRDKTNPTKKKKAALAVLLILMSLAHFWSGICLTTIFILFVLIDRRAKMVITLIPAAVLLVVAAILTGFNPFYMLSSDFQQYEYNTVKEFFMIFTRNMGFLFPSLVALVWLYLKKQFSFIKIMSLLLAAPILLMLFVNLDWVWRTFYFMPLLILAAVVMSYVFEGQKLRG